MSYESSDEVGGWPWCWHCHTTDWSAGRIKGSIQCHASHCTSRVCPCAWKFDPLLVAISFDRSADKLGLLGYSALQRGARVLDWGNVPVRKWSPLTIVKCQIYAITDLLAYFSDPFPFFQCDHLHQQATDWSCYSTLSPLQSVRSLFEILSFLFSSALLSEPFRGL